MQGGVRGFFIPGKYEIAIEHFIPGLQPPGHYSFSIRIGRIQVGIIVNRAVHKSCTSRHRLGFCKFIATLPVKVIVRHIQQQLFLAIWIHQTEGAAATPIVGVRRKGVERCVFVEFKIGRFFIGAITRGYPNGWVHHHTVTQIICGLFLREIQRHLRPVNTRLAGWCVVKLKQEVAALGYIHAFAFRHNVGFSTGRVANQVVIKNIAATFNFFTRLTGACKHMVYHSTIARLHGNRSHPNATIQRVLNPGKLIIHNTAGWHAELRNVHNHIGLTQRPVLGGLNVLEQRVIPLASGRTRFSPVHQSLLFGNG